MHLFFIIVAAILTASWLLTPSNNAHKPIGLWPILIPVGAVILGILLMSL